MSRKKRSVILGPDGKPYVAPPKPEPDPLARRQGEATMTVAFDEGHVIPMSSWIAMLTTNTTVYAGHPKADFRDKVAEQVASLTEGFDGHGGEEMPAPPRDLTTYRDAYASARAKCNHRDAVEVLYQRQWSCDACGRILGRDDMRRAGYW